MLYQYNAHYCIIVYNGSTVLLCVVYENAVHVKALIKWLMSSPRKQKTTHVISLVAARYSRVSVHEPECDATRIIMIYYTLCIGLEV